MPGIESIASSPGFYYGRRQIIAYGTTAQPSYQYQPLTPADSLNPQPGDEFAHGPRHDADVQELVRIFRHIHRFAPFLTVFSQLPLLWDRRDLDRPAPDLLVAPDVVDPQRPRAVFDVAVERTRPRFVLEVTSPRLADLDLGAKLAIYAQGGVEEYFIVDSGLRDDGDALSYRVLGYRLAAGGYVPLTPDAAGRVASAVNRVWIGPAPGRDGVVVTDQRTGRPVRPAEEAQPSLSAAEADARHRASAIADQLSALFKGSDP